MIKTSQIKQLTVCGLLIAIGIIIPVFSPIKIVIPPASFTIASHVPIFLAMAISPAVATAVAFGTTLGFFIGGFPIIVVLRAATHLVFAYIGAQLIKKQISYFGSEVLSVIIGILHAGLEVCIVCIFTLYTGVDIKSQISTILVLIGFGTLIHSIIDYEIALFIKKSLDKF